MPCLLIAVLASACTANSDPEAMFDSQESVQVTGLVVRMYKGKRLLSIKHDGMVKVFPIPSGTKFTLEGKPSSFDEIGALNMIDRPQAKITIARSGLYCYTRVDVHLLGREKK